ncbi:cytochrome P450 12b1, mitochondrial-like [Neocloeon triangulifer]|uniref:cytochrome P450 12b1, mitochondrial-like n=1 Tax=Neocloeon triangulifer TaxID=2078957 RepID=UPI00286EFC3C|nr:cytochrome P450 12b1, mitochondrial-like [Neocloeon triangulifer]
MMVPEPSALERMLGRDPNPTRAVVMALDMLAAGIDTTSHSLTNVLLHVAENGDKQEKLFRELEKIMPDPLTPLTSQMLAEMKYLRACIKESMRLAPVFSGILRRTTSEMVAMVLSNHRVPAGVDVVMGNGVTSRSDEHFAEAGKFLPERWIRGGELEEKPFRVAALRPRPAQVHRHAIRPPRNRRPPRQDDAQVPVGVQVRPRQVQVQPHLRASSSPSATVDVSREYFF